MADMLRGDASRLRSALLNALDDFRQVADIFGQHAPGDLDTKSFYCTLFVRCLSLRQALNGETNHVQIQGFMRDALKQLESFISDPLVPHKVQDDYSHTFPGLKKLHLILTTSKGSHSKLKALRNCVAFDSKEKKTALLELLSKNWPAAQSETRAEILESALEIPRKTRQRPPEDVRPAANSLIRVLKAKHTCNCKPEHNCTVQLSLETHRAQLNSCNLDLYLGLEQVWQEARVQTNAYLSPEISNLSIRHRDTSHGSAKGNNQKPLVDRLCQEIIKITTKFPDYRLRFSLEKDCLRKLQSEESNFVIDRSQKQTSLTELLDGTTFLINDRIKLILSVLLGYAVLHLYETSWLPPTWGSCNVMFFRSHGGLPMRPYLSPRLVNDFATEQVDSRPPNSDEEEMDPDDFLLPPYPCLVGLAIVLMELHKAASFKSLTKSYGIQLSDETDLAARFMAARGLSRRLNEMYELRDQKKMVIHSCLDPKIDRDDDGEKLDAPGLQRVIYERIVRLLEDELEQSFSDVAIDKLDDLIQKLDLSKGGRPLSGTRNHDGSMLDSTSISTKNLNNPEIGRRVRFHSSSMDVIAETAEIADNISLPTARRNTYNARGSPKQQTESASRTMVQKHASIEAHKSFVAPILARKSPSDKPDTLRVMNIPDSMTESDLSKKLEQLLGLKCHVHSLARASRDARWKKHATVTFPGMPNSTLSDIVQKLQHQIIEDHLEFDQSFHGLTPLYDEGYSAMVDIIAIEGLGTNPFGTFRAPKGDLMWLRDFLPQSFPSCRILLYGYDSSVPDSMSNQSVPEIASTCKNFVTNFRKLTKTDERPIIWLGQSMGGLIIQEVLVQAHQNRSQRISGNLSDQTIGFLGYGVPINGLRNESLLNAVKKQLNFEMIRSICLEGNRPSRYLKDLANRFALCNETISVHHFYETNPSPDIWDPEADPQRRVDDQEVVGREDRYWVPRNHSELVKVPNKTDFVYTTTVQIISLILERQIPDAY